MSKVSIALVVGAVCAIVVAIIVVALLHGPQSTTCDGLLIRATVLDLAKKNSPLPTNTDYELDSIRTTSSDATADTVTCEGELTAEFNNAPYSGAHVKYTLKRDADGHVMVSVEGISDLHFP